MSNENDPAATFTQEKKTIKEISSALQYVYRTHFLKCVLQRAMQLGEIHNMIYYSGVTLTYILDRLVLWKTGTKPECKNSMNVETQQQHVEAV